MDQNTTASSSSSSVNQATDLLALLSDASLHGNVSTLRDLLQKDPLLLHRRPPPPTLPPLHTACKLGHTAFATELLRSNPDLTNDPDGDGSSPLHLAARNGHVDVVTRLVSTDANLCFVRDGQGMNPVHVAAVYGRLEVLDVLVNAAPAAARERVGGGGGGGESVVHLCVKRNRVEAVRLVVELGGDEGMVNAKDADGNSGLHLAVGLKHVEIIKFLLNDKRIQKNALNSDGLTPLDLFTQQNHRRIHIHTHHHNKDVSGDDEIYRMLKRANAKHSKDVKIQATKNQGKESKYFASWISDHRNSLMVVASLIATMAFQAGVNPPGGVWQDDSKGVAGSSVLADHNNVTYDRFLVLNTIGYFCSLSSIILLISGLPCKRVTVVIVMVTMWFAVTCMAATYLISVLATMPHDINNTRRKIVLYSTAGWLILMILFVSGHVINAIVKLVILAFRFVRRVWRCCFGKKDGDVILV